MSVSGTSTTGTSDSGYDHCGGGSNYNYLSFFARGSYGRRLEEQRSRDPALARFEEEKRRWRWITWTALSIMALANVVMATGLITWKFKSAELMDGSIVDTVEHYMKTELKPGCRPRYRKTKDCSQIAAQLFLVKNQEKEQVVWSNETIFPDYRIPTPGAFSCDGVEVSKLVGKFKIKKESFYQIHSHLSFHSFPNGSRLYHAIKRQHLETTLAPLAQENVTITHNCSAPGHSPSDDACFSSSLLATDQLRAGDLISIELKLNGTTDIDPLKAFDGRSHSAVSLVYDGKSSYFSIVKLGKLK